MNELAALHRAILERPDDDTLRLVYADRLDEMEITYSSCLPCRGRGKVRTEHAHCVRCGGRGKVKKMSRKGMYRVDCSACAGKGKAGVASRIPRRSNCEKCNGRGYVSDTENRDQASLIRIQDTLTKQCLTCAGAGWVLMRAQYDPKGADVPPDGYIEPCSCNSDWRDQYTPLVEQLDAKLKERNELHKQEHELLDRHWKEWVGPLAEWWPWPIGWQCGYPPCPASSHESERSVEFRRGFVEKLTVTLGVYDTHTAGIFARQPIREVCISDRRTHAIDAYGMRRYHWYFGSICPSGVPLGSWIPYRIGCGMATDPRRTDSNSDIDAIMVAFATREIAVSALSRACVIYGRESAGLPEWEPS